MYMCEKDNTTLYTILLIIYFRVTSDTDWWKNDNSIIEMRIIARDLLENFSWRPCIKINARWLQREMKPTYIICFWIRTSGPDGADKEKSETTYSFSRQSITSPFDVNNPPTRRRLRLSSCWSTISHPPLFLIFNFLVSCFTSHHLYCSPSTAAPLALISKYDASNK